MSTKPAFFNASFLRDPSIFSAQPSGAKVRNIPIKSPTSSATSDVHPKNFLPITARTSSGTTLTLPPISKRTSSGRLRSDLGKLLSQSQNLFHHLNASKPCGQIIDVLKRYQEQMNQMIDDYLDAMKKNDKMPPESKREDSDDSLPCSPPLKTGILTHELRSPLTAVMQALILLQSGTLSEEEKKKYISLLGSAYQQLEEILTYEIQDVDVTVLKPDFTRNFSIAEIFERMKFTATIDARVRVEFQFKGSDDIKIDTLLEGGDFRRILLMLINFTSNGIKYTKKSEQVQGKVQIIVSVEKPIGNEVGFLFDIIDQGPGMTEEFIRNKLFREGATGEKAENTTQKKSNGIGLFLCKVLYDLMKPEPDAEIDVKSVIGTGTRIRFKLNFKKVADIPELPPIQQTLLIPAIKPKKVQFLWPTGVLFAEDHTNIQDLARGIFSMAGAISVDENPDSEDDVFFKIVPSGKKALESYENRHFHIVITDMNMPDGSKNPLNGFDVAVGVYKIAQQTNRIAPTIIFCSGDGESFVINGVKDLQEKKLLPRDFSFRVFTKPTILPKVIREINGIREQAINGS